MKNFKYILCLIISTLLWAKDEAIIEKAVPLVENTTLENESEKLIQQELEEIQAEIGEIQSSTDISNTYIETTLESDSTLNDESDTEELTLEDAEAQMVSDLDSVFAQDSASEAAVKSLILDMTSSFMPTVSKRISGPYGIRTYRMHRGVDLGLCHGENRTIRAAFSGKVVKVRNQGRRRGYGKYVILDHGNGLTTLYAHLASWSVKVGDFLQAGDTIGVGGNTGRSFGAHLHFEMRYNGLYIDPATVFNFEEGTYRWEATEIDPVALQQNEDFYQKELSKHRYYKVRRGDCLGKIARKYGISIKRLKQLNGLKSNMIRPGQVLRCS